MFIKKNCKLSERSVTHPATIACTLPSAIYLKKCEGFHDHLNSNWLVLGPSQTPDAKLVPWLSCCTTVRLTCKLTWIDCLMIQLQWWQSGEIALCHREVEHWHMHQLNHSPSWQQRHQHSIYRFKAAAAATFTTAEISTAAATATAAATPTATAAAAITAIVTAIAASCPASTETTS